MNDRSNDPDLLALHGRARGAAWRIGLGALLGCLASTASTAMPAFDDRVGLPDGAEPVAYASTERVARGPFGAQLPLLIEENRGQVDESVDFLGRAREYAFYLRGAEVLFPVEHARSPGDASPVTLPALRFVGANRRPAKEGGAPTTARVSYLLGNDPSQWRIGIPTYTSVRYRELYPGVDVRYYANGTRLEYDLVLAPGVGPGVIELDFPGFSQVRLGDAGQLILETRTGTLVQHAPRVYQVLRDGSRRDVAARYELGEGSRVSFRLAEFDPTLTLVIDPVIEFSSLFGSSRNDESVAVATDTSGDVWIAGTTDSDDLPVDLAVEPPWQASRAGKRDAFLAKFSADGFTLLSATYFGGTRSDHATAVSVTASGEVIVAGYTDSADFPSMMAAQPLSGGKNDMFVSRFSGDGSALIYSTYLGGIEDDRASGLAVDAAGNAFVVGRTRVRNVPPGAPPDDSDKDDDDDNDNDNDSNRDALVTKLDPSGALAYSTLLGGRRDDEATAVAVDAAGDPLVVGVTKSKDLPLVDALQPVYGGGSRDAFVARLDGTTGTLAYSSYLGGSKEDEARGIAVDGAGSMLIVGLTRSKNDFPLANASQPVFGGDTDAFVSKLSQDGATLEYSTFLGGKKKDEALAVATDGDDAAHVVGETRSRDDFPAIAPVQPTFGGKADAFVAKLKRDGGLVFSSYLGGRKEDSAHGVAVPSSTTVFVTGTTRSEETFPADDTPAALAGRKNDAFLAKLDYEPPVVVFDNPTDGQIVEDDTVTYVVSFAAGEADLDLDYFSLVSNGIDVTGLTTLTPDGATYTQQLAEGENTATASVADVNGLSSTATVAFTVEAEVFRAIADCAPTSGSAPLTVRFRTRGEFSGGSIVRYRWDFEGDGRFDTSDSVARDYTRTFGQQGTFDALLEVTNNLGETATEICSISVAGNAPTASASATPSNGPVPLDVAFSCTGSDSDGTIVLYEWDFEGDGTFDFSSPTSGPTSHVYATEGTFSALCRVTDNDGLTGEARTTTTTIRPAPPGSPTVTATASPGTGNAPLTVSFGGSAVDDGTIVLWEWDFEGDGTFDFSSPISPATIFTYTAGGIFGSSLRATDDKGNTGVDTVEMVVNVSVSLSIPNNTLDLLPSNPGATVPVHTTLSGSLPVRILLKNASGEVVRTLVDETRAAGTYDDAWDGRDDAGQVLPQGTYYALLEYAFGGEIRVLDLTNTTGGSRTSPPRSRIPSRFSPFAGQPLTIQYTLSSAREVTAFIGRFNVNTRLVTFFERMPMGRGTQTLTWNGENAQGVLIHPPPGDSFLFGIFQYTLPSNAMFLHSGSDVSALAASPSILNPTSVTDDQGTPGRSTITFDLSNPADVELTVDDAETGARVARLGYPGRPAGANTIAWDGRDESGALVAPGRYRLGVSAIDSTGYQSLRVYVLQRVYY